MKLNNEKHNKNRRRFSKKAYLGIFIRKGISNQLIKGSCKKEEIKKKMEEKKIKDEKLDPECTFKPSLIN